MILKLCVPGEYNQHWVPCKTNSKRIKITRNTPADSEGEFVNNFDFGTPCKWTCSSERLWFISFTKIEPCFMISSFKLKSYSFFRWTTHVFFQNLASCESAIENTESNLNKLQIVLAQLQSQQKSVETSCDKISQVRWKIGTLRLVNYGGFWTY